MAKVEEQASVSPGREGPLVQTWQKALLALVALPLLPSLAVLAAGMAPTFVALVADRGRGRFLTLTIGLPNFCGCLPALVQLWSRGQGFSAAGEVLADPMVWATAFGGAAIGWLVCMVMPPLVAAYYAAASQSRHRALRTLQENLIEVWGEGVAEEDAAEVHGPNDGGP
jgi:hypothetical protein